MRRVLSLLLVGAAFTANAFGGEPAATPVRTLNWNANPARFRRSLDWVRDETTFYLVPLADEPLAMGEILHDARRTGSSTLILDHWLASRRSGCAPIDVSLARTQTTANTHLKRAEKNGNPSSVGIVRWASDARYQYLQVDLPSSEEIVLADRPVVMLRVRASHAGRFMTLSLLDREGGAWSVSLDVPEANAWVQPGPFTPGLDRASIDVVRSVRVEKTGVAGDAGETVEVEIGAILATAPAEKLGPLFVHRGALGTKAHVVREIAACRERGGRVIVCIDAMRLPDDCRFVAGGLLKRCVRRDAKGRAVLTRDADGACAFAVNPDAEWSRVLSDAVAEELLRGYGVDGVCVTGLPEGDAQGESAGLLLGGLRARLRGFADGRALFVDRANATTLGWADCALGPKADDLARFHYASAGILVDVPVRDCTEIDRLHETLALGLKVISTPADLARPLAFAPGSAAAPIVTVRHRGQDVREVTFSDHLRRLAAARRSLWMFFDAWRGGRFVGRSFAGERGAAVYHYTHRGDHLYVVVNASDEAPGPIVLDVSQALAERFTDAVTDEVHRVREGLLTFTLGPHAIAMLHTVLPQTPSGTVLTRASE